MKERINLILDTDIGPDCDDAGALGLLHLLSRQRDVRLLAVTNCTSNPYGNGAIDAINRAYGVNDVPIGMWEEDGFLCDEGSSRYNAELCLHYENRFRQPPHTAPSALETLKTALAGAEDGSVTVVGIGPLNNLARLLQDPEGKALVSKKAALLVTMSCGLHMTEWNIEMDIPAAQCVFEHWPTPIIATPWETGNEIITGVNFQSMREDHPVAKAYELYAGKGKGRSSWDLTAIWMAVVGTEPFFTLSEPCSVAISDKGETIYSFTPEGRVRFLLNRMDPAEIGAKIDRLWGE
jgi:inosine-uridine nucleoside N-ribohydrolase